MERAQVCLRVDRGEKCAAGKDQISELPDEINLIILSFLGYEEAAKTMVISKKWRFSWTYVPNLDFDYWRCQCPSWIYNEPEFFHAWATFKFVAWVNQVVTAHRALTIKRFRVRFYLDETFSSDIDKWVDFCLRKEVQELELNCSDEDGNCHGEYYTFGSMWLAHLPQNTHMIRTFTKLRSFYVESLKISGPLLEVMLSKCHLLVELCLKWCVGVGKFEDRLLIPQVEILKDRFVRA